MTSLREAAQQALEALDSEHPDIQLRAAAALRAAAERAACADICDQHASVEGIAQRCAEQIRARGKI
jgi:hypothetical protein